MKNMQIKAREYITITNIKIMNILYNSFINFVAHTEYLDAIANNNISNIIDNM
jgi:hypothetical protein